MGRNPHLVFLSYIFLNQVCCKISMEKGLNKCFNGAQKYVERTLGINLTLIELVELKKDVEFTYNLHNLDLEKRGYNELSIIPDFEAALIFMNRNYGTQFDYHGGSYFKFDFDRTQFREEFGFDCYSIYFQRLQDEICLL